MLTIVMNIYSVQIEKTDFDIEPLKGNNYAIINYKGDEKNIIIVSQVENKNLIEISDALYDAEKKSFIESFANKELIGVSIQEGIYSIGQGAFYNNKINKLKLPSSLNYIKSDAFSYNNITELELPKSLYAIGEFAFSYNKIKTITFSSNITYIGKRSFYNNKLESIILPDTVKVIGDEAFLGNPIKTVIIGASVDIGLNTISEEFFRAYAMGGSIAGKYIFQNNKWIYKGL